MFAKTVVKTLCRLTLVDTFPDTISEVVAKTLVITITCVKTEAPVKTNGDIDAGLQAYTHVDKINEFKTCGTVASQGLTFS